MKTIKLKQEQLLRLRNNVIIAEALEDTPEIADDYKDDAMTNVNQRAGDPTPTAQNVQDSGIYGDITKGLYNYAQTYNMPEKVAGEIEGQSDKISAPMAKHFIEKLLYGIYRMSADPSQNGAFERLLATIGARLDAKYLTKNATTQ
jgi:hypothetical protein